MSATLDTFDSNKLNVARGTMKLICTFVPIMGGNSSHREAARIIEQLTGKRLNVKGCTCPPSRATAECYCPDSHESGCNCRRRPVQS